MSWQPAPDPTVRGDALPAIETVIVPRSRDIGGFEVRRALPSAQRRMVGSFVFLDQMGPATLHAGRGIDVRPHPHIGLATVTYLFEGSILHRDSLGSEQVIVPGDLNWMTAGRGIAHSERTDPPTRLRGGPVFGMQAWVALPKAHEETEPAFAHHGQAELPVIAGEGKSVRVIAGSLYGARSPVATLSDLFYGDATLEPGARLPVPPEHEERAVYVARGAVGIDGETFEAGQLVVLRPGAEIVLSAPAGARVMLLGGEPMDGPRHLWWNFVSSSQERIEQAKRDWKEKRFGPVPNDDEFIPLPE